MKPLSEVAPGLLVIQIPIQAVWSPSKNLYFILILGKNEVIWGYFQNIWQSCFWGQRTFKDEFWDFDLEKKIPWTKKNSANLENVRQFSVDQIVN